jgi:hypothetical protein
MDKIKENIINIMIENRKRRGIVYNNLLLTICWWDGYREDIEAKEIKFKLIEGTEDKYDIWIKLRNGEGRHISTLYTRWFRLIGKPE